MLNYYSPAPIPTVPYNQPATVTPQDNNNLFPVSEEDMNYNYPPQDELRNRKAHRMTFPKGVPKKDWKEQRMDGLGMADDVIISDVTEQYAGLGDTWGMSASQWGAYGDDFEQALQDDLDEDDRFSDPVAESVMIFPTSIDKLNPSLYKKYESLGNLGATQATALEQKTPLAQKFFAWAKANGSKLSDSAKKATTWLYNNWKNPKMTVAQFKAYAAKIAMSAKAATTRGTTSTSTTTAASKEMAAKAAYAKSVYDWYKREYAKLNSTQKAIAQQIINNWKTLSIAQLKSLSTQLSSSVDNTQAMAIAQASAQASSGGSSTNTGKVSKKVSSFFTKVFSWPFGKADKSIMGAFKLFGNVLFMGGIGFVILKFLPYFMNIVSSVVKSILNVGYEFKRFKFFGK